MNCIYCHSTNTIKKGLRRKKHEKVRLYFCKHCERKFTPLVTRHKTFPLKIILDALSFYNRLNTLEVSAKKVTEKHGIKVSPQNISNWLNDFGKYLPFLRMREFVAKKYNPKDVLVESKLFHSQIYSFKYHRAKCDLILNEEFRHFRFAPLQEFLELTVAECPHQVFKESQLRASQFKDTFNLDKVKITPKENMAVRNTRLVLQAVANNKLRHEVLQDFMIVNDSVTVATEVPVLLDADDLKHYRDELRFEIPGQLLRSNDQFSSTNFQSNSNDSIPKPEGEDKTPIENLDINDSLKIENSKIENFIITGHIDLIQIRNGSIHIMDFKPSAKKVKPVDQLTLYALAMSRLTSIRLFYFRCAWFDKDDYFEFFPLHVVHKKKKKRKKIAAKKNKKAALEGDKGGL